MTPEYIILSSHGHILCDDKQGLMDEIDNLLIIHDNHFTVMTYEEYDRRLDEVV